MFDDSGCDVIESLVKFYELKLFLLALLSFSEVFT